MKIKTLLFCVIVISSVITPTKAHYLGYEHIYSMFDKSNQYIEIVRSMDDLEQILYCLDADLSTGVRSISLLRSGKYVYRSHNNSNITVIEYDKETGYFSSKTNGYDISKKEKVTIRHVLGTVVRQGNTLTFTHIIRGHNLLPVNKKLIIDVVEGNLAIKDLVGDNMRTYTKVLESSPLK
ncbi:hypothetical protein [Photobacterium leiognathi]|uniref:Uncharacterized protein n=2 Tax=Photobacterium leiognathi TaxID=553611 RepID=V5EQH5_PHOLE|nr:hypothetical protein [Photobacterium leiognathi]KJF87647.1 hypothetical protein UB42_17265 [Photobacterium leiognathi]PSV82001.1 hypothetical protein CTM94_11175 [Photobacterium leiognathi]GAD32051.1 hypothetical protein PLEI_3719 [Photobacterium leiognathi lrivu.4.1]